MKYFIVCVVSAIFLLAACNAQESDFEIPKQTLQCGKGIFQPKTITPIYHTGSLSKQGNYAQFTYGKGSYGLSYFTIFDTGLLKELYSARAEFQQAEWETDSSLLVALNEKIERRDLHGIKIGGSAK